MGGNASEVETAAVLIALRTKGETVDELVGLAATMRRFATPVETGRRDLIDTAGTGGGRQTFNVSTTAALIAAGAGCAVAKHGNRSATGLSGSADVLEALGVRIDLDPRPSRGASKRSASASCSRPPTTARRASWCRSARSSALRTIFNFLGPLTNPAGAHPPGDRRVRSPPSSSAMAGALARLGGRARAGRARATTASTRSRARRATRVVEVDGRSAARLHGHAGGGRRSSRSAYEDRFGGPPEANALTTRRILAGAHRRRARHRGAQRGRRDLRGGPRRRPRGRRARGGGGIDSGRRRRGARPARRPHR